MSKSMSFSPKTDLAAIFTAFAIFVVALVGTAHASSPGCSQASMDGKVPNQGLYTFQPSPPIQPFYQWMSNQGYCGEVSLIQAGMAYGQWTSQYNVRAIATTFGSSVSQTGAKKASNEEFLSQLLLDNYAFPNTTEGNSFGAAAANLRLKAKAYNSAQQATGLAGFKDFMSWIKAEVMAGHHVTIGVHEDAKDREDAYSHIVSVVRVESNNPTSQAYDPTDVLYIDDHGAYTCSNAQYPCTATNNRAVPPGSGSAPGCTPFVYGYKFADWPKQLADDKSYLIPMPTTRVKNYAYSVSGVMDTDNQTLPVSLAMSSRQPHNAIAGHQYEAPYIGTSNIGRSSTNIAPAAMAMNLTVTVSGLVPGLSYNLYRYQYTQRPLPRGPLSVPVSGFNANAKLATATTTFKATGSTYRTLLAVRSSDTVVFRCVLATA